MHKTPDGKSERCGGWSVDQKKENAKAFWSRSRDRDMRIVIALVFIEEFCFEIS